jgi:hypothetical protein
MYGIFWEVHQQRRIGQAKSAARSAASAASSASSEAKEVRRQLDKTLMIVEALWTMLREEHGWTDEQLVERVTEIDLRDGRLDGRVRRTSRACAECGRMVGADRHVCMWCGHHGADIFASGDDAPAADGPGGLAR